MKKGILLMASLAFFVACSNNHLPNNPKDKEKYVDDSGNTWIWNAMLYRWIVTGANGTTHYYYPSSASWKDSSNQRTSAPRGISPAIYSRGSGIKSSSQSSPSKGHVFGKTGRSSSVHA